MRLIRSVFLVALAIGTLGCQSISNPGSGSAYSARLAKILDAGELRVGLSGNQPPLNMTDARGQIIGLEADIMKALANSMGLEVRYVTTPFAELLPALEKGSVDLVISGMTITPERNARFAFVGPYFISGKSVLTKSELIAQVTEATSLDDPNRTYAALAGSTSEQFVREVLPTAKLVLTEDYDAAVAMVIDDKVEAMVADFPICKISVLRNPDAGLTTLATPFTIEPLGIALPADDPLFVNLIENYLNTLENTGILTQFKAKWFSDGSWISELP